MKLPYQPKGSMCAACENKHKNCSELPFSKMPVMAVHDGVKIVRCTSFKRESNQKE